MKIKSIVISSILVGSLNMVGCQSTSNTCENCKSNEANSELRSDGLELCNRCANKIDNLKYKIVENINTPGQYTCENCGKDGLNKIDMYDNDRFCENCYMSTQTMNCTDCGGKFNFDDMHHYDGIHSCDDCFQKKVEEVQNSKSNTRETCKWCEETGHKDSECIVCCYVCGVQDHPGNYMYNGRSYWCLNCWKQDNKMNNTFNCIYCGKEHTEIDSYYNEDGMSACSEGCFNAYTVESYVE